MKKNYLIQSLTIRIEFLMAIMIVFSTNASYAWKNPGFPSSVENIFQQKRLITGRVISSDEGMGVPGANVIIKGTRKSVVTDMDGNYSIEIDSDENILVFSFVGYNTQEIKVGNESVINVKLTATDNSLKEVVIVGFGTQKKASMVSSITTIKPKELKGPTSNLTTMLAGRVSGLIAYQRSGEPGKDNANFFIRGLGTFGSGASNPLILVDGIESTTNDLARLQPDDIDSFSVLKDAAAAAVYGARGANGVVLVTTKMGKNGVTKFNFRVESRVSSNTKNFDFADNITYMKLANEAVRTRNPERGDIYNQNKIARTAAGDDPYLYPSNNWIDELIKPYTINQGYNLNVSGGGEKARYYVAGTYNVDNGVLKVDGMNDFNSNIKLRNYSMRSNVDMSLTPTTKAIIRFYGQFDDYNGPIDGGANIFNLTMWSNPVAFAKVYPSSYLPYVEHPLFGGALSGGTSGYLLVNPYAQMVKGYQVSKASTIQTQLELQQDLKALTPGLSANAMAYIRRYSYFDVARKYNPFYYKSYISPETGELALEALNDGDQGTAKPTGTEYLDYAQGTKLLDSRIYVQATINYNRTFNDKHAVTGMVTSLMSSYEQGNAGSLESSLPSRNLGISGRFTYGYDNRYLAEFNFGYNGSERFADGHRYGFFPSVGLAYNISNEKFWEPIKDIVTNFKIRSTYGLVGNDQIGNIDQRFFYLSDVRIGDNNYGAAFGEQYSYYQPGVYIARYANENIGWEESRQINLGLDMQFFNALNFVVDIYKQHRTNILQTRSNIGATMGLTSQPSTNFGEIESKGLDLAVTFNKQLNQDWYTELRGNFTFSTNKVLVFDEINFPENMKYRSRVGQNFNQAYGYIAERLFVDQNEVDNSPTQFGDYTGGDIKYRDVNGDGVISPSDMVPLGYPTTPEIVYGFGGTIGYKKFDFSIFFQGAARTSFFINPENIAPFVLNDDNNKQLTYQNNLLNVIAQDHWSEDNRDSYAFWPRLSDKFVENNNQVSTWWMRDGSFLRLKSIEIGYNAPKGFNTKIGVQDFRIYVNGSNLAVWSAFKMWDPEMGGSGLGYPIQSVYNVGLKVNF
ncbi:SusC/RagA family TonB-linked outer membrane protein [Flavobacterium cheongpyeongense]|uniref:SusC/RagA family TonB-linked outer membrane protein n=1 Tax=Flavobacterium cheongpyeongense TaxID=2212651 RepID=A0A2V4BIP2_9FLAO|nr:TonB-dependent receptor [Flavobacterium cheongpyeongense]PXY38826.1 SusC/RagA family TonB-linked outer membrane protein [Flavobacterium cheongpyeongense]